MSLESNKGIYSIRELKPNDKESVLAIWSEGRSFLKEMGVSQWQKGDYPGEDAFLDDLAENRGRVVVSESTVVAVFAFTLTPELSYTTLKGSWKTEEGEYLTIHRTAVKMEEKGKGLMGIILSYCIEEARKTKKKSVRIDTHKDNKAMIKSLEKNGFEKMGVLTLSSGSEEVDERLGYEKLV